MEIYFILQELICNEETLRNTTNCATEYCECVHVLKVGLGDTVELILIDEGHTYSANHPMHLHGNYFRVVGMDKVSTYKIKFVEQTNCNFCKILSIYYLIMCRTCVASTLEWPRKSLHF